LLNILCVIPSTYAVDKNGRCKSVNAEQSPLLLHSNCGAALRSFNRALRLGVTCPRPTNNYQQNGATRFAAISGGQCFTSASEPKHRRDGFPPYTFHAERLRIETSQFATTHFSARRGEKCHRSVPLELKHAGRRRQYLLFNLGATWLNCDQLSQLTFFPIYQTDKIVEGLHP